MNYSIKPDNKKKTSVPEWKVGSYPVIRGLVLEIVSK